MAQNFFGPYLRQLKQLIKAFFKTNLIYDIAYLIVMYQKLNL